MRFITLISYLPAILTLLPLIACSDNEKIEDDTIDKHVKEDVEISPGFDHGTPYHHESHSVSHISVESDDLKTGERSDISDQGVLYNQIAEEEHNNHQPLQSGNSPVSEPERVVAEDKTLQTDDKTNIIIYEMSADKEMTVDSESSSLDSENNNSVDPAGKEIEEKSDIVSNPENVDIQNSEKDSEVPSKKQRYFPLLYTFSSLFSSFLAEFGEVTSSPDTTAINSSDASVKNSTSGDGLVPDLNTTSNSTEQGKRTRFQCSLHLKNSTTETMNGTSEVKIINSTELLEILNFGKNQKTSISPCVLVMFYTKWCHFSARAAPEYNALARAFPVLDVVAVDTSHFSYLNAKFGTVAVPNIMLFHSKSAVRFNHTTRDLEHFIQFVSNNTGLDPTSSVSVLPQDYEGPLSSQVVQGRDWLLWLAWAFILVCSTYGFFFSLYGQAVIARLRFLWQEHQHIE